MGKIRILLIEDNEEDYLITKEIISIIKNFDKYTFWLRGVKYYE